MQINITRFFDEQACPRDYSASCAEFGPDAGLFTWQAAKDDAGYFKFLDTEDKIDAFKVFVRTSGGWSDEEINAWSIREMNALFLQWIACDIRECLEWDVDDVWANYAEMSEAGMVPSNLWRDDTGQVFFSLEG